MHLYSDSVFFIKCKLRAKKHQSESEQIQYPQSAFHTRKQARQWRCTQLDVDIRLSCKETGMTIASHGGKASLNPFGCRYLQAHSLFEVGEGVQRLISPKSQGRIARIYVRIRSCVLILLNLQATIVIIPLLL